MKTLDGLQSEGLHWVQVDSSMFKFHWELRNAENEVVASMRQKSVWSLKKFGAQSLAPLHSANP